MFANCTAENYIPQLTEEDLVPSENYLQCLTSLIVAMRLMKPVAEEDTIHGGFPTEDDE
jgi:hypothetical protein